MSNFNTFQPLLTSPAIQTSRTLSGSTVMLQVVPCDFIGRDLLWPRPTLANSFSYFGHDLLWPRPTLATTDFGHGFVGLTKFGQPFFHYALTFQNGQKCRTEKQNGKKRKQKRNDKGGTINIVRVCVKASPAEGRRRFHTNTAYAHLWGLGFRVQGLGFRVLVFRCLCV